MERYKTDVCVVGGGPGGSLLAYLLAKQGLSVVLLERHQEVGQEFRGEHLNEEGESILKKHGLFDKVEALGLLRMERLEYWQDGKAFQTIFPEPGQEHLGIHVPQRNLLMAILQEARKLETFCLMSDTRVTGLIQNDSGCFTGVEAKKNGKEIRIESSLVVGADGRFSTVRTKAEIPVTKKSHGYDLLWAKIPQPKGWEPSVRMALLQGFQVSLFTQAGGWVQIGWNIAHGAYPIMRQHSFEPLIDEIVQTFPPLVSSIREHIRSWKDFVLLDVHSSYCESWTKDGVILLGDAAHTMTPTGAFGLNAAMKDADVLAGLIPACLAGNDVDFEALKRCESERKANVASLQATQEDMERSFASHFAAHV